MRRIRVLSLAIAAGAALLLVAAPPASARAQSDLPWALKDVFHVAVRFIRVDRGCRITDKDAEAAFVIFECDGDNKTVKRGALELIPMEVQGRSGVRAQVTLGDEPHYVEVRFLELLERKLKDERGPVLPPRTPRIAWRKSSIRAGSA